MIIIIIPFIMHKMFKCTWQDWKRNKNTKKLKLQLKVKFTIIKTTMSKMHDGKGEF